MNQLPVRDAALTTLAEIEDRMEAIVRQRDRLDDILDPRDWTKHQAKAAKLTERHDSLWVRRANLLKAR